MEHLDEMRPQGEGVGMKVGYNNAKLPQGPLSLNH